MHPETSRIQAIGGVKRALPCGLIGSPEPPPPCRRPRPTLADWEWCGVVRALSHSPRQGQVIRGIFQKRTYATIGANLNIAADTVEEHWREAKTKPKLKDIADHTSTCAPRRIH